MTKRIFALLTALMLLTGAVSALAELEKYRFDEGFAQFDLEMDIPEGALCKQYENENWLCLQIWYEEPETPIFDIDVAFSEELAGKNLGELTDEEKGWLVALVGEGYSEPAHAFFDTVSGNTILFTREIDSEAGDYATMMTVYKGFFFSLYAYREEYAPLTDEDFEIMHQIIEGAWIIDTEKE